MFLNLSSLMTSANLTYSNVYDQLLTQFGSTYFTDTIFMVSPCINFIGLWLNLISIRVLFGENFKSIRQFAFMKVNLINSAVINILMLPVFLIGKRFAFANDPYGPYYLYYLYAPFLSQCSVFSALIDVSILLDRITLFTRKLDFIKKYSVRFMCLILFTYTLFIGLSHFVFIKPDLLEAYLSETSTIKFYFVNRSQFVESQLGSILLYVMSFFKDFVSAALVTSFSFISTVLFKRYLTQRSKKFKIDPSSRNISQLKTKRDVNESASLQQSKAIVPSDLAKANASSNTQVDESKPQSSRNATSNNQKPKISRADRSATLMAIVFSLITIVERTFALLSAVLTSISEVLIAYNLAALLTLIYSMRHSFNFLILYLFNKKFKSVIDAFLRKYF
jgi:hypothetical protein